MKRLLMICLLVPLLAFAAPAPVSFDFAAVSLVTFAQATFKSILGRDYVISPDVVAMDRKITISVKKIDVSEVPDFVESLLKAQGIRVTERGGVYFLDAYKVSLDQVVQDELGTSSKKDQSKKVAYIADADDVGPAREVDSRQMREINRVDADADSVMYVPQNRTAEFVVLVLNSAFGGHVAQAAGSQVVLTARKERLKKIVALADVLDRPARLVDVSASFVEVSKNSSQGRGISLIASVLGAKFGVSLGSVNSGSALSLKNTNFELVIDALNNDGRFKQVSNSRVVGDENERMSLTVGDETPTISSTGKDNSGNAIQNVVYRPSGVILDVLPKVLGSGKISLAIDGQISSFQATVTGVSGSPTLVKRQVKTSVTLADGEVLLIGGLNDTKALESTSGLAFLPASWSAKSGSKLQTDLVLILSAKVAQ
ncbi:type II secretion system protein GspD [Glaciimonas sp. PCH181]|uniref:type II secretion system protein GspD n=1 Tax=Glaciimonas sp. PCH181 TaxID=2133943 RepID=UPI001374F91C|nr:hypothetical protein [Glaciimonas sp. PCH181]